MGKIVHTVERRTITGNGRYNNCNQFGCYTTAYQ